MKNRIIKLVFFFFFINCYGQKNQKKDVLINFLDEKYQTNGLHIEDNLKGESQPTYSYFDKKIGAFGVYYIAKTKADEFYWSVENKNGYFKDTKVFENDANNSIKIKEVLNKNISNYYIFVSFLDKKHIKSIATDGEFNIGENAYEKIYLYEGNKKWKLIKNIRSQDIQENLTKFYLGLLEKTKQKIKVSKNEKFDQIKGTYTIKTIVPRNNSDDDIEMEFNFYFEKNIATMRQNSNDIPEIFCEGNYLIKKNKDNSIKLEYKDDKICVEEKHYDEIAFYIKKYDSEFYIKSKRFSNNEWQKLNKN